MKPKPPGQSASEAADLEAMLEAAAELAGRAEGAGPATGIDYDLLARDLFDMFATDCRRSFDTPRERVLARLLECRSCYGDADRPPVEAFERMADEIMALTREEWEACHARLNRVPIERDGD